MGTRIASEVDHIVSRLVPHTVHERKQWGIPTGDWIELETDLGKWMLSNGRLRLAYKITMIRNEWIMDQWQAAAINEERLNKRQWQTHKIGVTQSRRKSGKRKLQIKTKTEWPPCFIPTLQQQRCARSSCILPLPARFSFGQVDGELLPPTLHLSCECTKIEKEIITAMIRQERTTHLLCHCSIVECPGL